MIIQWYKENKIARIFDNEGSMCAELSCKTPKDVDMVLHQLGSRRRSKWMYAIWGCMAQIRRR